MWSNRYPDRSVGEDAAFLAAVLRGGARLVRVSGADRFLYVRHEDNAWPFRCGEFLDPAGWRRSLESVWMPEEVSGYCVGHPIQLCVDPGSAGSLRPDVLRQDATHLSINRFPCPHEEQNVVPRLVERAVRQLVD